MYLNFQLIFRLVTVNMNRYCDGLAFDGKSKVNQLTPDLVNSAKTEIPRF